MNGKWYEPRGRTPSTHILKPPIPGFTGQVEPEMFACAWLLALACQRNGCWTERFGDISKLVVIDRYDRRRLSRRKVLPLDTSGGEVHRVHPGR